MWRAVFLFTCISSMVIWIGCDLESLGLDWETEEYPPPPLTAENIQAGPMEGYQYLQVDVSELLGGVSFEDALSIEQLIEHESGGAVYFQDPLSNPPETWDWWHGVVIDSGAISEDVLIGIVIPDIQYAVLEFSPHPYQFDAEVQLELSYAYSNLIETGFTVDDLEIMYWNESEGEYEIVASQLLEAEEKLIIMTNHFSRYVIAAGRGAED